MSEHHADEYYYSNHQRIPIKKAEGVIAVKARQDRDHVAERFMARSRDSDEVITIPQYGIQVFTIKNDGQHKRLAMEEESVQGTLPVYRQSTNQSGMLIATEHFFVQFKPDVTMQQIEEMNARYGVKIAEKLEYGENSYRLEIDPSKNRLGIVATANAYYESGKAIYAHPNFIRERQTRSSTIAPERTTTGGTAVMERADHYLEEQWHLVSAKVPDAWRITKGSRDITIAILDDGVDTTHPEFQGKLGKQYDFEQNTNDGNPKLPTDRHGTACAGVAVAAGIKAYGAAPECKLMAVRTPRFLGADEEANMFIWAANNGADVINCSWGPPDGTGAVDPLPDNVRQAIHTACTNGRQGKGVVICWAAGNGNESVSLDGYASNSEVLAIAACNHRDQKSSYSDFGKEILVCAPSSGGPGDKRILTVDRHGDDGYNPDPTRPNEMADQNYTRLFGGTSSASPLVAGIVGLMLSVNRNLTWRQVREILARTADKIGDRETYAPAEFGTHSKFYGYGRVNALRAVQETERLRNM